MSDDVSPAPTPRYSQVVSGSAGVAREMGHSYVRVEHLFLAMIRDRAAVPTQLSQRAAGAVLRIRSPSQFNERDALPNLDVFAAGTAPQADSTYRVERHSH